MNGEVRQITPKQAAPLVPETSYYRQALNLSSHILLGQYLNQPLCLVGFIPLTFLSEEAYIWMYTTEAAAEHKLMVARHAKEVVRRALDVYPRIFGDCYSPQSARWLRSLGARFLTNSSFEIVHG